MQKGSRRRFPLSNLKPQRIEREDGRKGREGKEKEGGRQVKTKEMKKIVSYALPCYAAFSLGKEQTFTVHLICARPKPQNPFSFL